jgi:hypothetical protein
LAQHRASAFGLVWQSDFALEHFAADGTTAPANVSVSRVAALAQRTIVRTIHRGALCTDGFRFTWDDQAAIDVYGGDRVEVAPLAGWTGTLPWAFYSTIAALLLAWRGQVPFHACGVAVDGRAVLICGPSGAGKSTLAAGLLDYDAALISDDLSIIDPHDLSLVPGRPTVRLFRAVAEILRPPATTPVSNDPRGKLVASFDSQRARSALPLGAIMVLGVEPVPEPLALRFALLRRQLFRPQWLAALPGHVERQQALREMVTQVPLITRPPLGRIDPATFSSRCTADVTAIRAALN